jgi:hypothetical protein
MEKLNTLVIALLFCAAVTRAQEIYDKPEIGKPIANVHFENVQYYAKKSLSLKEFRGKWLFLDFWYTGCIVSVRSLNHIDELQKKFKDNVQFLMVCINIKKYNAESAFSKMTKRYGFQLPAAFDSTLSDQWDIHSMPHIVIVDPQGIVYAITPGNDFTENKIRDLINGKKPHFYKRKDGINSFDISKFPGTPDSALVYRSILTRWRGEGGGSSDIYEHVKWLPRNRDRGIVLRQCSLSALYKFAYWGRTYHNAKRINDALAYPSPIIEVSDNTPFLEGEKPGDSTHVRYNYNLAVPSARGSDPEFIKHVFQQELKNAFGYDVQLEKRKVEVYRLLAKPAAIEKLKTKGGQPYMFSSPAGLELKNMSMSTLCSLIIYPLSTSDRIFIEENETGYSGNIDIKIDAITTNFEDVQTELKKHGFEIVKEPVEMNVIVIRDPKI